MRGFKYIGNTALDLVAQGFEVRILTAALRPQVLLINLLIEFD